MTEPLLTARNIVKRYGRVTAIDHADFDLRLLLGLPHGLQVQTIQLG